MAFKIEVVVDVGINRGELLLTAHLSENAVSTDLVVGKAGGCVHEVTGPAYDVLCVLVAELGHGPTLPAAPRDRAVSFGGL